MEKPLAKIKRLLGTLPTKDIPTAENLYNKREFTDLLELVDSAIVKVEKERRILRRTPDLISNPKYTEVDLDQLETLQEAVSSYSSLIEEVLDEITWNSQSNY